jgi:hypothetical protein
VSHDTGYPTIPPVTVHCTYAAGLPYTYAATIHYCTYAAQHTYPVTLHYCTYAAAAPYTHTGTSPVAQAATAHCTWAGQQVSQYCGTTPVAGGAAFAYPPTTLQTWVQPQTQLCTTTPVAQAQGGYPPPTSPVGQAQGVYPTQICTIPHTIGFTCTYVPPCPVR